MNIAMYMRVSIPMMCIILVAKFISFYQVNRDIYYICDRINENNDNCMKETEIDQINLELLK